MKNDRQWDKRQKDLLGKIHFSDALEILHRIMNLRISWVKGTPTQRITEARDFINPSLTFDSQELIRIVSGIEGLSRSLLLNRKLRETKLSRSEAYNQIWRMGPDELVRKLLKDRLEDDYTLVHDFEMFLVALEVRNFIIHEAGFFRQGYTKALIKSGKRIFEEVSSSQ